MTPLVSGLSITPVKATRLRSVAEVGLTRFGVPLNRRFYLIDGRDRMLNAKHVGELCQVVADYDGTTRRLALAFPGGEVAEGVVSVGDSVRTRFYSRDVTGRLVDGPWSAALSGFVGFDVRLVEAPAEGGAVDRGTRGTVSLVSRASLARLASEGGESDVDARRFRMLIEVDGVTAHAEDEWVGRRVRIGDALIAFRGHVGRCLITSRDPESGAIDLPTLDILGGYRRDVETTEPLPFGVYGEVLEEGTVRVGDTVSPQ